MMYRTRRRKILRWTALLIFAVVVVVFLKNSKKRRDGGIANSSFPKGFLNVAIWEDMCGDEMLSLKEFPLFPHGPSTRLRTSSLQMHFTRRLQNFGLRIFGYLSPGESGNYDFDLASSASSELWISLDSKPENSKLIGNVTTGISWSREGNIPLSKGNRYYLEILHKHGDHYLFRSNYLHLKWRLSHWKEHDLRDIPSDALIAFEDDHDDMSTSDKMITNLLHSEELDRNNEVILPMHIKLHDPSFVNAESKHRVELHHLPFISEEDSRDLFPSCQYSPSYIVKEPLWRYQSTWETHYSSIYPFDYSDLRKREYPGDNFVSFGNDKLDENTAKTIASQVWMQIQSKHPGKYSFRHTLNVEENHDEGTGDRYLVELELLEISSGKSVRFSEYVYRTSGTSDLCSPVGISWNKSAVVNIILTTGNNQGRWLLHFLYHMSKIHRRTKDFNFNVVITEYDGIDVDLKAALKRSGIPHYQHVRLPGKFQKALGLQLAAGMVKDPNSILFVMDLHLDIPYHFFDDVRKHCIQHRIAYNPLLIRLSCGTTAHRPFGFWEKYGYGLIAMYKSDWDRIGGMNVEEFKNKWGGEDWEICDRILMDGMEIERVKMMHLFHYFHSKRGMWADNDNAAGQADYSDNFWV